MLTKNTKEVKNSNYVCTDRKIRFHEDKVESFLANFHGS